MRPSLDDAPGGVASEIFEAIASLGAAVLAICGLVGIYAPIMAAVATIVFGVALAANGARNLRDYDQIIADGVGASSGPLRFSVLVAGVMGAALAIFALFGADPAVLTPLASVIFGAGVVLKSNIAWELSSLRLVGATHGAERLRRRGAFNSIGNYAAGVALSGLASGALGAIAMAGGPNDLALNLIAIVVAAFTLALGSRIAVTVMALLARPISLMGNRASVARKLWRDDGLR
ncbi:hypothetical protein WOC76_01630 [Methylocystis sp. IM3]|uniref:hypothetical protein n=1 Tax=unclassified Methylocystis TaxID=2625913 RepID=UPI0030FAF9E9